MKILVALAVLAASAYCAPQYSACPCAQQYYNSGPQLATPSPQVHVAAPAPQPKGSRIFGSLEDLFDKDHDHHHHYYHSRPHYRPSYKPYGSHSVEYYGGYGRPMYPYRGGYRRDGGHIVTSQQQQPIPNHPVSCQMHPASHLPAQPQYPTVQIRH